MLLVGFEAKMDGETLVFRMTSVDVSKVLNQLKNVKATNRSICSNHIKSYVASVVLSNHNRKKYHDLHEEANFTRLFE